MDEITRAPDVFAIVELLGRRKFYAWIEPADLAGTQMLRATIPIPGGRALTQLWNPASAIYSISPLPPESISDSMRAWNEQQCYCLDLLSPDDRERFQARREEEKARARELD